MFIATLIAAERLLEKNVRAAGKWLLDSGCGPDEHIWIEPGKAADIPFQWNMIGARAGLEKACPGIDVVVQAATGRKKKLLVADMDSTMIAVECIDELADFAGVKAQVAAVTERAMRGDLDFEAALDARVALLRGLEESAIDRCRAERVRITPGAKTLVGTMRAHGAHTVLVSGGFTRFADPVAAEIGFDKAVSNELLIAEGRLSGGVRKPIVGAAAKRQALLDSAAERGIPLSDALVIGDGANDIPMIEAAGLGVAFHAKPAVAAAAAARIAHNDLTALLYAQGYARREWVETWP